MRLLALIAVLGCARMPAVPVPAEVETSDPVAVVLAAFDFHFANSALDSAALDLDPARSQDEDRLTEGMRRAVAERVGLPVARRSLVLSCSSRTKFCELQGLRRLVGVQLDLLEDDRAIVTVQAYHRWTEGRVDIEGAQYELRRIDDQWVVDRKLVEFVT